MDILISWMNDTLTDNEIAKECGLTHSDYVENSRSIAIARNNH